MILAADGELAMLTQINQWLMALSHHKELMFVSSGLPSTAVLSISFMLFPLARAALMPGAIKHFSNCEVQTALQQTKFLSRLCCQGRRAPEVGALQAVAAHVIAKCRAASLDMRLLLDP